MIVTIGRDFMIHYKGDLTEFFENLATELNANSGETGITYAGDSDGLIKDSAGLIRRTSNGIDIVLSKVSSNNDAILYIPFPKKHNTETNRNVAEVVSKRYDTEVHSTRDCIYVKILAKDVRSETIADAAYRLFKVNDKLYEKLR